MIVEMFEGYAIVMRGLNHFACPGLKLYGYGSIRQLRNAIRRAITKLNKEG
jgi:hypothetical protein